VPAPARRVGRVAGASHQRPSPSSSTSLAPGKRPARPAVGPRPESAPRRGGSGAGQRRTRHRHEPTPRGDGAGVVSQARPHLIDNREIESDKSGNVPFSTHLDETLPLTAVVPQGQFTTVDENSTLQDRPGGTISGRPGSRYLPFSGYLDCSCSLQDGEYFSLDILDACSVYSAYMNSPFGGKI